MHRLILFLLPVLAVAAGGSGVPARTSAAQPQQPAGTAQVVMLVPETQCSGCVQALTASLRKLGAAAEISPQTKRAVIRYDPRRVTVQQLADAVGSTPGQHGKVY